MFNLFWYAVFCPCPVAVFVVKMTYFSRRDLLKVLNTNGRSPYDEDYAEKIEKHILIHFNLLREELVDEKKFKNECSLIGSKVRSFLEEESGHMDRMLGDKGKHKVIS